MQRIAQFEKVSYEQYVKDFDINDDATKEEYENITLPKRSTNGSAGYDFVMPYNAVVAPGNEIVVPTGIRCLIKCGWVLMVYPRSSMGFKYHMSISNTVGIIDSDYYYADNEGHIMIKIYNGGNTTLVLSAGDRFVQGVFTEFGITEDDDCEVVRSGGIGSTGE